MKKDVKKLFKLAKKVVSKQSYKKIKSIKDLAEQEKALKYSLIASLEKAHTELEREIKNKEKDLKNTFFAKNKSLLVPSKIKHFSVEYDDREFYKLFKLLKEVRHEVEHV